MSIILLIIKVVQVLWIDHLPGQAGPVLSMILLVRDKVWPSTICIKWRGTRKGGGGVAGEVMAEDKAIWK